MMTHRDRMRACLKGEKYDRFPVALWRHFPVDDQTPGALAKATISWQHVYDFDFVKVTPASSFCIKDWGAKDIWEGHTEGSRRYIKRVINHPNDWQKLKVLDPSAKFLSDQLTCLRMIRKSLDPDTPMIQTIFNPLAQAKNLAGNDTLILHLRTHPEAVLAGLETISRTTIRFIEALYKIGIDGIFYAVQHAQANLLTSGEYESFSLPFDKRIFEATRDFWLNLLHLHGRNVYFPLLSQLPFPIINWHDRETKPDIASARKDFNGIICGGMRQDTLAYRTPPDIKKEISDAIRQAKRKRIILSTGCVVPVITPHGNIIAARKSVEE